MKKILVILFLAAPLSADCGIPDALNTLRPGAQWNVRGTQYAGIEWLDLVQVKPTQNEVLSAIIQCTSDQQTRQAAKVQARLDVRNNLLTQAQRLQALLILLDFDK